MAILNSLQKQSYLNFINQAPINPKTRKHLIAVIEGSNYLDQINDLCSRATKINISIFQAITNPPVQVQVQPVPTPTPDPAPVVQEVTAPVKFVQEKVVEFQVQPVPAPTPDPAPVVQEVVAPVEPAQEPVVQEVVAPVEPVQEVTALVVEEVTAPVEPAQETVAQEVAAPVIEEPVVVEQNFSNARLFQAKPEKVAHRNVRKFNFDKKVDIAAQNTKETAKEAPKDSPKVMGENLKLSFYTCDEDEIKKDQPVVVNNGGKDGAKKAVENCVAWTKSNKDDLFSYVNGVCKNTIDDTMAKAACYVNIIPQNNSPEGKKGAAVFSCNEVNDSLVASKVPFTYLYNSEDGKLQHLKDCSNWLVSNNEYALSLNGGECREYNDATAALAGCLNSQE